LFFDNIQVENLRDFIIVSISTYGGGRLEDVLDTLHVFEEGQVSVLHLALLVVAGSVVEGAAREVVKRREGVELVGVEPSGVTPRDGRQVFFSFHSQRKDKGSC